MLFIRWLLQTLIIILLAVILLGAGMVWYFNQTLPNVNELKTVQMQVPLRVYTADGKLIAEFGEKRRQPVPLSEIPLDLQHAVIATEDQRFYDHAGVDFMGLTRAALQVIATGKKVQGGSTITMQVARNFFLDRKKTYVRKIKEILLALKIGRELSKDKVLELYLNKVYFGKRAYGAAAAANVYYGKTLDQLTLAQMAMLAGLPQAPSSLNPINNPQAALARRAHVLQRMLEQNYITRAQYQQAMREPDTASYHHLSIDLAAPYVAEMVRDQMFQEFGDKAYEMGLSVYTTINSANQLAANKAVENGLLAYDKRHGYREPIANWVTSNLNQLPDLVQRLKQIPRIADLQPALVLSLQAQQANVLLSDGSQITLPWNGIVWARKQYQQGKWLGAVPKTASDILKVGDVIRVRNTAQNTWQLAQAPDAEAALISLNPQNGAIYAVVGGFNFVKSNFNRVISAKRQPGSGFKPFLYSAALNQGMTLATLINDMPIVLEDPTSANLWRPQNDDKTLGGPTRLRQALAQSRNLVSIRILREIGIPYAVDYIKRFGFTDDALPPTLSLALGTGIVTPYELARGLATFANGGSLITPYFINKIVVNNQDVLFTAAPQQVCYLCNTPNDINNAPQIIPPQNAYLINSAMKSVITEGTGRAALVLGRTDLAGKTGTTQDYTDAWFSGFNTRVLTVTWLGFDQPRSIFEYGSAGALPIWIDYMRDALQGMPAANLAMPPDIVTVRIDAKTGQAADSGDTNSIFEIFRSENAPKLTENITPANSIDTTNNSAQPVQNANQPLF